MTKNAFNQARLRRDVARVQRQLNALRSKKLLTKGRMRKMSRPAGNILLKEMRKQTRVLDKNTISWFAPKGGAHYRYRNGELVAWYTRGNLKRAQATMSFRKSPHTWVGTRVKEGTAAGGVFQAADRRADGYYGYWVDQGTDSHKITVRIKSGPRKGAVMSWRVKGVKANHYIKRSVSVARPAVYRQLLKDWNDLLEDIIKQAKVNNP